MILAPPNAIPGIQRVSSPITPNQTSLLPSQIPPNQNQPTHNQLSPNQPTQNQHRQIQPKQIPWTSQNIQVLSTGSSTGFQVVDLRNTQVPSPPRRFSPSDKQTQTLKQLNKGLGKNEIPADMVRKLDAKRIRELQGQVDSMTVKNVQLYNLNKENEKEICDLKNQNLKLLQLLSKMDFILSKLAAKSTGNTDPYYPLMLKPGTVYVPPDDTKPDIDNTMTSSVISSMTSPKVTEKKVLPVLLYNEYLREQSSTQRTYLREQMTNQNQEFVAQSESNALATVNDDIEVHTVETCQSEDVKVEPSDDVMIDEVMPIETIQDDVISNNVISNNVISNNVISNNVISNNVITNNVISNNIMSSDVITNDVPSSDVIEIQVEAIKMECDDPIDQPSSSLSIIPSETETFFIGANQSELEEDTITEIDLSSDDHVRPIDSSSKNEFFEQMFAKRMRRKICPKPGGKDALESQVQPFRKPDRRFKHRNYTKDENGLFMCPFAEDGCTHRTKYSSNLSKHVRLHTGEKPHECSFCGKTFTEPSGYKNHMKIHAKSST